MRAVVAVVASAAAFVGCGKAPASKPGAQTPAEIEQIKRRAAEASPMVRIPGGCFMMGTDSPAAAPRGTGGGDGTARQCIERAGKEECYGAHDDEKPAHEVCLDPFEIDEHEVTFGAYGQCAQTLVCEPAALSTDIDFSGDRRPAAGIAWPNAAKFCAWLGRRLPTEAEWEFAARGADGRTYPWGDEPPTCERVAMRLGEEPDACGRFGTKNVGSFPLDRSPFGVMDMGGNLREWVEDRYDPGWYATLAGTRTWNPRGPETSINVVVNTAEPDGGRLITMPEKSRVARGGTFLYADPPAAFRTTNRRGLDEVPNSMGALLSVGFRCARSIDGSGAGDAGSAAAAGDGG